MKLKYNSKIIYENVIKINKYFKYDMKKINNLI